MNRPASIEVRCRCGKLYHADPSHAGKSIRCKCGRILPIRVKRPRFGGRGSREIRNRLALWWAARGILTRAPRLMRLVTVLAWGYLVSALGFALLIWTLGDQWWMATALLFGPRWMALLPAPILALLAVLLRPALATPVLLGVGIVLGPGMGFRSGWRGWLRSGDESDLRIITYNIAFGENPGTHWIPHNLEQFRPDVVLLQECNPRLEDPQYWPPGWTIRVEGTFCLGSKYPVEISLPAEEVRTGELGGTGLARRYRLTGPGGPIDIVGVHLETPRKGLEPLRYGGENERMDPSTFIRDIGSRRLSRWIRQQSRSAIVAGDFNMPVESAIYRRHWSDCANAFSQVGRGFGYTRVLKRFSVRIDHVLACGGWTPVRAFVGPDLGSDHLPLIVDLRRSK